MTRGDGEGPNWGNFSNIEDCKRGRQYRGMVTSLDLLSLLLGQPLSARLLWVTLSSKQIDILSANVALFNNILYCFVYVHLFVVYYNTSLLDAYHKFVYVYVQVGGPLQLCFICLERYIAVIYPTHFPLLKKYRFRETCVTLVWIVSLSLATVFLINKDDNEKQRENIGKVPAYLMGYLSGIVVYMSYRVAVVLRNPAVGKETLHPAKRRAFVTICATSVLTMSFYTPVMVADNLQNVGETAKCTLTPVCIFFVSVASLVHPLFYLHNKQDFSCCRRKQK